MLSLLRSGVSGEIAEASFTSTTGGLMPAGSLIFPNDAATKAAIHASGLASGMFYERNVGVTKPATTKLAEAPKVAILVNSANPANSDTSQGVKAIFGADATFVSVTTGANSIQLAPTDPLAGIDVIYNTGQAFPSAANATARARLNAFFARGGGYIGTAVSTTNFSFLTGAVPALVTGTFTQTSSSAGGGITSWNNVGGADSPLTGGYPATDFLFMPSNVTYFTAIPTGAVVDGRNNANMVGTAPNGPSPGFVAGLWRNRAATSNNAPVIIHGNTTANSRYLGYAANPFSRQDAEREWTLIGQAALWSNQTDELTSATTFPVAGGAYTNAGFDAGCSTAGGDFCGTADAFKTNESQTVTVTNATGGTFTLTFNGQTTAPIAVPLVNADLESKLEALSNIDDVAVTGTAERTVTFLANQAETNVPQLTADASGLTGTTPTVTIATVAQGGSSPSPRSRSRSSRRRAARGGTARRSQARRRSTPTPPERRAGRSPSRPRSSRPTATTPSARRRWTRPETSRRRARRRSRSTTRTRPRRSRFPANGGVYNAGPWAAGCSTPADDVCGTSADGGSGPASVTWSMRRNSTGLYWDGSSFSSASPVFATATGAASWSASFAFASFPADGAYTLTARAKDQVGNEESGSTSTFVVDTAAPTSTATLSGTVNLGWWRNPTVTITATDGAGNAGVQKIEYRLDGGPWLTYSAAFQVTGDGSRLLEYRATDNLGNVEAIKSLAFNVDGTAPTTTASVAPAPTGGYYRNPVVTLTGDDGLGSGVAGHPVHARRLGHALVHGAVPRHGRRAAHDHVPLRGHDGPRRDDQDAHVLLRRHRAVEHGDALAGLAERLLREPDDGDALRERLRRLGRRVDRVPARLGLVDDLLLAVRGHGRRVAHGAVPRDRQRRQRGRHADAVVHDRHDRPDDHDHAAGGGRGVPALRERDADVLLQRRRLRRVELLGPGDGLDRPGRPHTYTVTATDNAGNTTSRTTTYTVIWPGFAWGATPKADAGKTVNVKFTLGGSNYGLGVIEAGYPRSVQVNCTTGAEIGAASATTGALSYSGGTYTYAWTTPASWKNTCRKFVLVLDDTTVHTLTLQFK